MTPQVRQSRPAHGEVWYARLDPVEGSEQAGRRPVLVVSRDALNDVTDRRVAVPFTSMRPERSVRPTWVLVEAPDGGMANDSLALCEQLRVLSLNRFVSRRGRCSPQTLSQIKAALRIVLDLDD